MTNTIDKHNCKMKRPIDHKVDDSTVKKLKHDKPYHYFEDIKFGNFRLHYGDDIVSVCSKGTLYQKSLFIRNILEVTPDLDSLHITMFDQRTIGMVLSMVIRDISLCLDTSTNNITFKDYTLNYTDINNVIRFLDYFGVANKHKNIVQKLVKDHMNNLSLANIKKQTKVCLSFLNLDITFILKYIQRKQSLCYLFLKHAPKAWIQEHVTPEFMINLQVKNILHSTDMFTIFERFDDNYKSQLFMVLSKKCDSYHSAPIVAPYNNLQTKSFY